MFATYKDTRGAWCYTPVILVRWTKHSHAFLSVLHNPGKMCVWTPTLGRGYCCIQTRHTYLLWFSIAWCSYISFDNIDISDTIAKSTQIKRTCVNSRRSVVTQNQYGRASDEFSLMWLSHTWDVKWTTLLPHKLAGTTKMA